MKVTNKLLVETANSNLSKIFANSFLCNNLNNSGFCDLVVKQISILEYAEKKEKSSDKLADSFLKKLNTINNSNHKITSVSKLSLNEMYDELQYISVYIKNVFKYDFVNEKSLEEEAQKVDSSSNNKSSNGNEQSWGQAGFNGFGGFNSYQVPSGEALQQQWMQHATMQRLAQDIHSGTFYQYTSKPKIVLIFKYIIGSLAILFALLTLVKIILASVIGNISTFDQDGKIVTDVPFYRSGFFFSDALTIICSFLLGFSVFKNNKNDNFKYYFSWKFVVLFLAIFSISVISDLVNFVSLFQKELLWKDPALGNDDQIPMMIAFFYVVFVYTTIYFLLFIVCIITISFNPKLDRERIRLKQEEIYKQIKESMLKNEPKF